MTLRFSLITARLTHSGCSLTSLPRGSVIEICFRIAPRHCKPTAKSLLTPTGCFFSISLFVPHGLRLLRLRRDLLNRMQLRFRRRIRAAPSPRPQYRNGVLFDRSSSSRHADRTQSLLTRREAACDEIDSISEVVVGGGACSRSRVIHRMLGS